MILSLTFTISRTQNHISLFHSEDTLNNPLQFCCRSCTYTTSKDVKKWQEHINYCNHLGVSGKNFEITKASEVMSAKNKENNSSVSEKSTNARALQYRKRSSRSISRSKSKSKRRSRSQKSRSSSRNRSRSNTRRGSRSKSKRRSRSKSIRRSRSITKENEKVRQNPRSSQSTQSQCDNRIVTMKSRNRSRSTRRSRCRSQKRSRSTNRFPKSRSRSKSLHRGSKNTDRVHKNQSRNNTKTHQQFSRKNDERHWNLSQRDMNKSDVCPFCGVKSCSVDLHIATEHADLTYQCGLCQPTCHFVTIHAAKEHFSKKHDSSHSSIMR